MERLSALLVWSKRTDPGHRPGRMRRLIPIDPRASKVARADRRPVRPRVGRLVGFPLSRRRRAGFGVLPSNAKPRPQTGPVHPGI